MQRRQLINYFHLEMLVHDVNEANESNFVSYMKFSRNVIFIDLLLALIWLCV